jgi:hypothetical protein
MPLLICPNRPPAPTGCSNSPAPIGGIENRSFHVKDGTFAQDACRVRSGNAPIALAHLRDCTLALIRRRGAKPKPPREAFAANPRAAIRAILTA